MRWVFIAIVLLCLVVPSQAQYWSWSDAVNVTTASIDSAFDQRWEQVNIKFEGCDGYVKYGTSNDTTSWDSRDWMYLAEGEAIQFESRTPLTRLEFKAASGSGKIYFTGYKRRRQY